MLNNVYGLVGPATYGPAYPAWYDVTTPAAGATASLTIDGRWQARVIGARLSITTDANVANRFVSLDYVDQNGVTRLRNAAGLVVTASTTGQAFEWSSNRTVAEWAANTPVLVPLAPFFLPAGWSVKFAVDSIQATDAISGLRLWVEQFQTGRGGYQIGVRATPELTPGELLTAFEPIAYAPAGD